MYDTMPEQEMKETVVETLHEENEKKSVFIEPTSTPFVVLFLWSLLLSVLSVANPFLTNLSTNLQVGQWRKGRLFIEIFMERVVCFII